MLVNYIFRILCILVGSLNICEAIDHYQKGHYYHFGLMIMMAIYMAIYLFKISMDT